MQLPSPSYESYLTDTVVVLVPLVVMQHAGLAFGAPGELNVAFLATVGVSFPLFIYLLTVVAAITDRMSQFERLVDSE